MADFDFLQVDVFSTLAARGNPLAVVRGADGLSDAEMANFARWTNLSETTFLLTPRDATADYRVRMFTPERELPFAGHPTLGSAHAWLQGGGVPKTDLLVQECGVGLVRIRQHGGRLAFAAPPLLRTGEPEEAVIEHVARGLGVARSAIIAAQWIDNGPGWVGVMLADRQSVLAVRPDGAAMSPLKVGICAACDPIRDNIDAAFEIRAFVSGEGTVYEDPVTGSLNAGMAQWLIGENIAPDHYVASQGTVLQRDGRVHVERIGDDIWIGGATRSIISGTLSL